MSNLLTDWRTSLIAHLETAFPAAVVEAGPRPTKSPSRDVDRISVFTPGFGEAGDVNFANPLMTIRYWVKDPKTLLKPVPMDDSPLEQAAWDLATALQAVQTTLDAQQRYYFRLVSVVIDREEYGCQAQLLMWTTNPATVATS